MFNKKFFLVVHPSWLPQVVEAFPDFGVLLLAQHLKCYSKSQLEELGRLLSKSRVPMILDNGAWEGVDAPSPKELWDLFGSLLINQRYSNAWVVAPDKLRTPASENIRMALEFVRSSALLPEYVLVMLQGESISDILNSWSPEVIQNFSVQGVKYFGIPRWVGDENPNARIELAKFFTSREEGRPPYIHLMGMSNYPSHEVGYIGKEHHIVSMDSAKPLYTGFRFFEGLLSNDKVDAKGLHRPNAFFDQSFYDLRFGSLQNAQLIREVLE